MAALQPDALSLDLDSAEPPPALVRHPVLDARREVHGYELLDRSAGGRAAREVLLQREPLHLSERRLLFVSAGPQLLQALGRENVNPANLVLQVAGVPGDDAERIAAMLPTLQALHGRGFQLAFNASVLKKPYAPWLELAAYVKINVQAMQEPLLSAVLRHLPQNSNAQPIAYQVPSQVRFEELQQLGVPFFQGTWFARPAPVPTGTIKPSQAIIIELVNLLRADAEIEAIEAVVKRDPSLSFNLLRIINSAGMRRAVEVTSLRHAVMIMGQQRLFRWVAVLMTRARAGGTAPAAASAAMVRGRLMELLAAELLPPQDCDNAFVTGVFSLLDVLLDLPLPRALDAIALPQSVADALLHRRGLYAPFLALTEACESGDEDAFAQAAQTLHLTSHQVNWAHLQALAWAEELAAAW